MARTKSTAFVRNVAGIVVMKPFTTATLAEAPVAWLRANAKRIFRGLAEMHVDDDAKQLCQYHDIVGFESDAVGNPKSIRMPFQTALKQAFGSGQVVVVARWGYELKLPKGFLKQSRKSLQATIQMAMVASGYKSQGRNLFPALDDSDTPIWYVMKGSSMIAVQPQVDKSGRPYLELAMSYLELAMS